jgi:ABC-type branched-subunit amino acid transport system substrate-binding protein
MTQATNTEKSTQEKKHLTRRRWLQTSAALTGGLAAMPSLAQAERRGDRPPTVGQLVDVNQLEQDVSKDFLVGTRTAWQEINATGGIRGKKIRHNVVEVDSSLGNNAIRAAFAELANDGSCIASFGTCGDSLASEVSNMSFAQRGQLSHSAPWLQSAAPNSGDGTFAVFSDHGQQIAHALSNIRGLGIRELTVVFQDKGTETKYQASLQALARDLRVVLRLQSVANDLAAQGRHLSATSAPLVLFLGGTPELIEFLGGWRRYDPLRHVVALANVNLHTVREIGGERNVSVVGTQAVPAISDSLPVVRRFKLALARFYDEQPTALSLAGYLSAHYTAQVIGSAQSLIRSAVADAFAKSGVVDLGGFRVDLDAVRSRRAFVTQTMLAPDGRILG